MEQLTAYRIKGKEIGLEFLFKYDLNGNLKLFEVATGQLNESQQNWLFKGHLGLDLIFLPFGTVKELNQNLKLRFPASEQKMISDWVKNKDINAKFEIHIAPADLSFEAFWKIWDLKVKRENSEKAWNKLNEADKIKCFLNFKNYQRHLNLTGQAKAHLVTWLNQKRYNDEY